MEELCGTPAIGCISHLSGHTNINECSTIGIIPNENNIIKLDEDTTTILDKIHNDLNILLDEIEKFETDNISDISEKFTNVLLNNTQYIEHTENIEDIEDIEDIKDTEDTEDNISIISHDDDTN